MTNDERNVARLADDLGFQIHKISQPGFAGGVTYLYCLEGRIQGLPHLHNQTLSRIAFFLIERATDGDDLRDDDIYVF